MSPTALACPSCEQMLPVRASMRALQGEGAWNCEICSYDGDDCDATGVDPWSEYPLGSTASFQETQNFARVAHVTHCDSAIGIIKDNTIKPRSGLLPSDHQEMKGCWAGLDAFPDGSRFGNVAFDLDFLALIQGKHFHWLEPQIDDLLRFRFVVSDQERIPGLQRYDPSTDDKRPWFYDRRKQEHFCRSKNKYGFFFVGEIGHNFWEEIRFVDHHPHLCSRVPLACEARGKDRKAGREEFYRLIERENVDLSEVARILV